MRDHGIGIDPDHRDQIFEPFARVRSREDVPDTGLGLWITKAIAEAHGGRITVESEPGRGSTFTAVLPSADAPSGRAGGFRPATHDADAVASRTPRARPLVPTAGHGVG